MAHHRIKALAVCLLAAVFASQAFATGGWDEVEAPTLSDSLDQLPAKSYGSIFAETAPLPSAPDKTDYAAELGKITDRIGKDTPEALGKSVEELLAKARLNYKNSDWCNLLEDALDVVKASSKEAAAAQKYLRWRVEHRDWFGFQPASENANDSDPSVKAVATDAQKAELARLADAATGPIKAHWIYLKGAILYDGGDRTDCKGWFEEVMKEFPGHPRAEAAQFLLARCDFSATRADNLSPADLKAAQKKAAESFMQFRRDHPGSRFDADALGWLGAIAFDTDDSLTALKYYIAQAEDASHPEQRKSAVFMCEKTLAHLVSDEDNSEEFALIAQHPGVAMGYMYQVLNAPESDNFDGKIDPPEKVRKWRRKVLPLIAAQVAKHHDLYKADTWQPRYLAMLALAASESGDQAQALQITQVAADQLNRSDDLLFARGIASQRAGHAAEAIESYRALLKLFPKSAIAAGVRLRLALALQDDHQAGAAIVELHSLCKEFNAGDADGKFDYGIAPADSELSSTESAVYPDISGANVEQVRTIIDTLLNFAPLPELAAGADDASFDDAAKSEMRAVVAERYLAAEDFANAKKYMTPAQYSLRAAKLEALTSAAVAASTGKERAEKFAAVGDAWAASRGELLTLPLDGQKGLSRIMDIAKDDFYTSSDLLERRENGHALGFAYADTELENRDELRHASRWWMRAARESPGSGVDASARLKALEAMPKIAALSSYAETRARETKAGEASRQIYDRLLAECPDSAEAKRYAAYWDFPGPPKDDKGNDDTQGQDFASGEESQDLHLLGYEYDDYEAFGIKWRDAEEAGDLGNGWQKIDEGIKSLAEGQGGWSAAHVTAVVDGLAKEAKKLTVETDSATRLNFLEDLSLFVREKAVTPKMLQAYVKLRVDVLERTIWDGSQVFHDQEGNSINRMTDDAVLAELDKVMKDPELKPVEDYIACARLGMVAGRQTEVPTGIKNGKTSDDPADQTAGGTPDEYTYPSRDYAAMEKQAREFLQKYPHSNKREAVMFVLARAVQNLSRAHMCDVGEDKEKTFRQEPFSAKRVLAPLDAYDKEFPKGRYSADIRDYRAYVAWQTHDWPRALDLTMAELDDGDTDADLQVEASLRLASVFAELADKDQRPDLMAAIRARPAVWPRLKDYLATVPKNPGHPLRYMQAFLTTKLLPPAK